MDRKYSVITGFLGKLKDRFIDYTPAKDIEGIVETAAKIKGCSGLEVIYPHDFGDPVRLKELLKGYGLGVSSVNLNLKSEEKWRFGSISNPDPAIRKESISYFKTAMDMSAELGCNLVTVCPLADGSDYPFEFNYIDGFKHAVEVIQSAADYREDVKISLEYKAYEPRMHCLLNNAGKTAYFCSMINRENVGITLDVGHAYIAGEIPADSAAFLGVTGKLFYVHINDNYRNWDWDMIPGTVNILDYLEFILFLKKVGYNDWITADVFPQRHDAVKTMEKTFEWMDYLFEIADRLDEDRVFAMMKTNDAFDILDYVRSAIGK